MPLKTEAGARDIPILPAPAAHRAPARIALDARSVFAATSGRPKRYRNARRALGGVADTLDIADMEAELVATEEA